MEITVYKPPAMGRLTDEAATAYQDLADRLATLGHDVRREDEYMAPGRRGIVWGEVVVLYVGMKALDVVTGDVIEATLRRVVEVAKTWGRERWDKNKDKPRPRPETIIVKDKDDNVLHSWTISQDGEKDTPPGEGGPPSSAS